MKISATIITLNEEENIAEAIRSLTFADEIVVVDSESTDLTVDIAHNLGARVLVQKWLGYAAQKNFAAQQASHEWIFNLDADERISPELAHEIEGLKQQQALDITAFEMPRRVFYLGKWIKHSGWYPDYKIRLYNRTQAQWQGDYVHESVKTTGKVARLRSNLLHYTVRNASEHHQRIDRYTTLAAEEAFAKDKSTSWFSILLSPFATFIKTYLFKLGFLDGIQGVAIAYFAAHYVFLKNLKLWEKRSREADDSN
jgi:glycosyltransferase involved in cell wall biosynthesis